MEKKRVVITGGSRGIGKGLAREFLRRGQQVVINGRNEDTLHGALEDLKHLGGEVAGLTGDIQEEKTFQDLIDLTVESYGKIDIWINNAGVPQAQKYFHELSSKEIQELISISLTATMQGSRKALRFFLDQGHGQLFNMEGFGDEAEIKRNRKVFDILAEEVDLLADFLVRRILKNLKV